MSFVQHEIDDIENNNYIYDKLTVPFYIPFYALLRGMRAIKPKVVLLFSNTSCNTAPKIRRFLPKYWKYLNETITFTDNALHNDKNIGTGRSPLRGCVARTRELYHEFRSDVRSTCPERESRGILASIINKNIYNTGPSTTAIFRPSFIDILFTTYIQLKVKNIFPI